MNYSDIGYNNYLLRPLEATYTEQIGIDSASAFEQISGSQIQGDKIFSLNKFVQFNLEEDRISVNDGNVEFIEIGKSSEGIFGLIIYDKNKNRIGLIDSDGLTIFNGKINILNDSGSVFLNNLGLSGVNNFITDTIYTDQTYEISISDPAYRDMELMNFNLSLKKDYLLLVLATANGSTDLATEPTRMGLSIDNIPQKPVGILTGTSNDSLSLFYTGKITIGSHNLKLRFGKGVVATQSGILEGIRFSYILF